MNAAKRTPEPPPRPRPRVVKFRHDDTNFAVLSVTLDDEDALAGLSPAEREVATMAAAGSTNAEIAKVRKTSRHTVANQMASILRKLRVGSRVELAARLARCPLKREDT